MEKEARTDGGIDRRLRTCPTPLLSNNHTATSPPATAAPCCPATTLCESSCLPLAHSLLARTRASEGERDDDGDDDIPSRWIGDACETDAREWWSSQTLKLKRH